MCHAGFREAYKHWSAASSGQLEEVAIIDDRLRMEFLDMAFTILDYFLLWSYTPIYVYIYIYIYIVIFEGCKTIHFEEHMKMGTIESRVGGQR